jgi:alpha-ribazole phosphatase
MDFGEWDGRARTSIEAHAPDRQLLDAFYRDPATAPPPGGEAWTALEKRVATALDRILSAADAGPVLVLTHAGPIRAALRLALDMPLTHLWTFRLGYGSKVSLEVGREDGGRLWGELLELSQP